MISFDIDRWLGYMFDKLRIEIVHALCNNDPKEKQASLEKILIMIDGEEKTERLKQRFKWE